MRKITHPTKKAKCFIGYQHSLQSKKLLKDTCEHVHKEIDGRKGRNHRKHGHTREFVHEKYKGNDLSAAYIHLLGDMVLDKICIMLGVVLDEIIKGNVESPFYSEKSGSKTWFWDIREERIDFMMKEWGKLFAAILKEKRL